jgi:hypothetical protein
LILLHPATAAVALANVPWAGSEVLSSKRTVQWWQKDEEAVAMSSPPAVASLYEVSTLIELRDKNFVAEGEICPKNSRGVIDSSTLDLARSERLKVV